MPHRPQDQEKPVASPNRQFKDQQGGAPRPLTESDDPLKREVWRQKLADHPDKVFAVRIVQGIAEGFRVGFEPGIAVEGGEYAVSSGTCRNCSSLPGGRTEGGVNHGSGYNPGSTRFGNSLQPLRSHP